MRAAGPRRSSVPAHRGCSASAVSRGVRIVWVSGGRRLRWQRCPMPYSARVVLALTGILVSLDRWLAWAGWSALTAALFVVLSLVWLMLAIFAAIIVWLGWPRTRAFWRAAPAPASRRSLSAWTASWWAMAGGRRRWWCAAWRGHGPGHAGRLAAWPSATPWDVSDGRLLHRITGLPVDVMMLAFDAQGRTLAAVADTQIVVWRAAP